MHLRLREDFGWQFKRGLPQALHGILDLIIDFLDDALNDDGGTDMIGLQREGRSVKLFPEGFEELPQLTFPAAILELNGLPGCLLYTSPSPRDLSTSRMPSSA